MYRLILIPTAALLAMSLLAGCMGDPEPEPMPVFVEQAIVEPSYLMHTVRFSGETLGIIAFWYTKKTDNWKAIQEVNPGLDVRRMGLGQEIRIPDYMIEQSQPLTKAFVSRLTTNRGKPSEQLTKSVADIKPEASANAQQLNSIAEPKVEGLEAKEVVEKQAPVKNTEADPFLENLLAEEPAVAAVKAPKEESVPEDKVAATSDLDDGQESEGEADESAQLSQDEIDRAELLEELLE